MVVQHALSERFAAQRKPVRTWHESLPPATLALKVAHSKTAAWRAPGAEIPEVWHRRQLFLAAVADHSPRLLEEYRALRPLGREVGASFRASSAGRFVYWGDIQTVLEIVRHLPPDLLPWLSSVPTLAAQEAVLAFHRELTNWASRWHLEPAPGTGDFGGGWLLEDAAGILCNELHADPVPLRSSGFGWTPPIHNPFPAIQLSPWLGDEPVNEWRVRVLRKVNEHLDAHIEQGMKQIEAQQLEDVPSMRSENRLHLEWAARWQVGGEDWTAFLTREGLTDRKADNVRRQIRNALSFIGIIERPGMRSV